MNALANKYNFMAPITQTLHKVLYHGTAPMEAIGSLMSLRFDDDVDYL